jgi:hypothetical protein
MAAGAAENGQLAVVSGGLTIRAIGLFAERQVTHTPQI